MRIEQAAPHPGQKATVRVLILGGRAPVALDHARRFAAHGWTVYVADSVSCCLSGWSRAVAETFSLPPPRVAMSAFATALADIIVRNRIDLVLPTCEEVFYLSCIRARLPSSCNVFVAPFEQLRELHSKWRFLAAARTAGVPVPESIRIMDLTQVRGWAMDRPIVLKPEYSRFGVYVRLYRHGLPQCPDPLQPSGPWVAQLFESGREVCSYGIAVAGRLQAHVTYVPKYRLHGSSSYYFEPVAIPRLRSHVERFVGVHGFTGQISFDWIERPGGECVALECNPRAISGLHLFDLEHAIPIAIAGGMSAPLSLDSPPPRMLAPVMLAAGLPAAVRRGSLAGWRRDWLRARDVLSIPGDRLPLPGAVRDLAAMARLAIRDRSSLRAVSTRDIEWDGKPLDEM